MDRLARGSLVDIPTPLGKPPAVVTAEKSEPVAGSPKQACDLATTCPNCSTMMQPEHAHYRCHTCGYRDSCCF